MKHFMVLRRTAHCLMPFDKQRRRERLALVGSCVLVFLLIFISLGVGSYPLPLRTIAVIVLGQERGMAAAVFWRLRLPRVLAGLCAGMVFGVSGAVCQTVFDNPLASPDLTGVASGASVGAAVAIVSGSGAVWQRIGLSFCGGMLALGALFLLVRFVNGERRSAFLLAGIIISAAADACFMVMKIAADPERELAAIEYFTMGTFAAVTWEKALGMLTVAVPATLLLLLLSRAAMLLSRGTDAARSLGLHPVRWNMLLLTVSTLAVAAVVSVVGVIGFAGLIVPHMAGMLFRRRCGGYFCLCAILGAALILAADLFSRSVKTGAELPVSIFCVIFSIAVLILLCVRRTAGGYFIGGS